MERKNGENEREMEWKAFFIILQWDSEVDKCEISDMFLNRRKGRGRGEEKVRKGEIRGEK